ncbi:MAG TPA: hypothetical protein VN325_02435 [Steroidobacteraceae bacterium]|nr:hypothetical protein [Steroidobacteraceae bacterium]
MPSKLTVSPKLATVPIIDNMEYRVPETLDLVPREFGLLETLNDFLFDVSRPMEHRIRFEKCHRQFNSIRVADFEFL